MKKVTIDTIGAGILTEGFERELAKVIDNIDDPNTEPGKMRKITIEVKFTPDKEERHRVGLSVLVKSTLAPHASYESMAFLGPDEKTGDLVMIEPTADMFKVKDDKPMVFKLANGGE